MQKNDMIIIIVIVLLISLTIFGTCKECEETNREAIKAGYSQELVPGTTNTYWTKK